MADGRTFYRTSRQRHPCLARPLGVEAGVLHGRAMRWNIADVLTLFRRLALPRWKLGGKESVAELFGAADEPVAD